MFNREKQVEWLARRHGRPAAGRSSRRTTPSCSATGGSRGRTGSTSCCARCTSTSRRSRRSRCRSIWTAIRRSSSASRRSRAGATRATAKSGWKAATTGSTATCTKTPTAWSSWLSRTPAPTALRRRALNQAARELLLAQSSDWAFIMKTGTMVEYAVERTQVHVLNFNHLYEQIKSDEIDEPWLSAIEAAAQHLPGHRLSGLCLTPEAPRAQKSTSNQHHASRPSTCHLRRRDDRRPDRRPDRTRLARAARRRPDDTRGRLRWLADKIVGLRIFDDDDGKMNRDLTEVGGGVLVVSQFTLYGDCRKGRRPSFIAAAAARAGDPALRGVHSAPCVPRAFRCRRGPVRRDDAGRAGQRRAGDADR